MPFNSIALYLAYLLQIELRSLDTKWKLKSFKTIRTFLQDQTELQIVKEVLRYF